MANTKQNNPGLGIEYEVHVPAHFALLLNINPEIVDFKLQSNVQGFGNFDDLLVDVTTKGGGHLYFAFQLKHKGKSDKKLLPTHFETKDQKGKKGDFNLEKYCETFKNLREEDRKKREEDRKKYHFILYTNSNFDSSHTSKVGNFRMKATQDVCCFGKNFFDTIGHGNNLYKFKVKQETKEGEKVNKNDYKEFFSKFSLYTGQANARDLEKYILNKLKSRKYYEAYIDFFRKWHKGDFTNKLLDKKTLNVHLVDILLSSSVINYYLSDGQDKDSIFFEELVQQFDITIFDASKQDFIKHLEKNVHKYPEEFNNQEVIIRLAKDHKFIDRVTKELNEETKLKLLHYFYKKPLILDFNDSSQNLIYEASKLCKIQESEIKLVILGQNIEKSKFSHLKIFTNLTDVNENFLEETKRRCKLSLQGRNISFGEIFEDEIRKFVTPREIFQMLKGSFSIGEDKEKLPECYIPRTVSAKVFDIELIIQHSSGSAAIIFHYEDKFEELKTLIHKIMDREDYLYEDFLDGIILRKKEPSKNQLHQDNPRDTFPKSPAIILIKENCSRKQFEEICEELRKKEHPEKEILKEKSIRNEIYSNDRLDICEEPKEKVIHLFQVVDEKTCLLLMSTKNIFYNPNYEFTKMSLKEKNIHTFFNKTINILCTQPGMGKSTLIKYLKNECDSNFWTVMVDLKAHNQFFKRNHKIEDVLNYFLELENCQDIFLSKIKKMFLQKRKIVFFLDGLDEVEYECVDCILDITKQLSKMGFRIWLTSRQNLQQKIENHFNIFAIEIDEINENQQKKYIEERLRSHYNENEIEEIVKKIFNNTDLASNRRILEIPLQLHIITQIFLDERSYYDNLIKNNFILTKMLEIFFEGRCKHNLTKTEVKYTHILRPILEEILKKYETVAVHSVLDDEHFKKLKIENFEQIQNKDWDLLGIIGEINKENKAVFEHLTFAEYFASKFLVKNFDKARILKEEIFSEKYQNLRIIFNIMLAENSPLHLAVIYKDLSRIQEMDDSSLVDKGGRNLLQVAACVATRHPPLESDPESITSECLVKDIRVWHFKGEDTEIKEIVNRLLSSETFKNDNIFEWNSLDYALVNGALYIVEAILAKFEKPSYFYKTLKKYYKDEVVAYYSIRFGYHHLLSKILEKESCHVTRIHTSNYQRGIYSKSIINYLFTSDCKNRTRIVELLTGDDINKIVDEKNGYNFFHFAVLHQDIKFIKFLFEKRADVNIQHKDGRSLLFLAAGKSSFEISKLLVENGADVNTKSNGGLSPLLPAVSRNNLEISKFLVANGADVNVQTKNGKSPLTWAVELNNLEILKLLVENGADVNIKVKFEETPLFVAINKSNFEISKLLVENGADVNIKNKYYGESPLFLAVNKSNFEISKLLVENGADVNTKSKRGWSPLLRAADLNNLEISKLLVENGADVNTKSNDGWTPLLFAADENNLEMSKLLIEKGADVDVKNKGGWSPLSWAVNRNNLEMSKLLIEKGADVNIKNKSGWSPLLYAADRSNLEVLKLLIEKGADVNVKNKDDCSPLFYASDRNYIDMSKLLIEKEADVNVKNKDECSPLFDAADRNNLEMSKSLIEKGVDVNVKNKSGWSPLLNYAADRYNIDMSKLLIEKGADVNVKTKDECSLLFYTVDRNNLEISKLLIENGADVNVKNKGGWSPLLYAAVQNNLEVSKLLIEKGADVNIKDKDGKSPLYWTAKRNNLEMSELLIEKGADVNVKGNDGRSPLYWTAKRNNLEMSQLLIEKGADVNVKNKNGKSPLFCVLKLNNNSKMSKLLFTIGAAVKACLHYMIILMILILLIVD